MLGSLFIGFVGGIGAWFFTDNVTKPLRRFFDLRREVNRCLVYYGNVMPRFKLTDEFSMRELTDISPEEDARLREAEKAFRNLGAEMRAFANADRLAYRLVCDLGYDADQIAGALIAYSNNLSTYGRYRFDSLARLEKLLRIRTTSA
jgi:hypothetical protein